MALNLASFIRPNTATIFVKTSYRKARASQSEGQQIRTLLEAFFLQNVAISHPGRVRLDLTANHSASRRAEVSRSPLEKANAQNIRIAHESVTITGSLSATPLSMLGAQIGGFGQYIRRDLREVEKLRQIQARREPVVLVTKERVYQSMAFSISEEHPGTNKVDLTLSFEEIRIVAPSTVRGVTDIDELLGAESERIANRQPTSAFDASALSGGGFGVG